MLNADLRGMRPGGRAFEMTRRWMRRLWPPSKKRPEGVELAGLEPDLLDSLRNMD